MGFLIPLLAPFSLLVSFCVLAGTGNSTTTLRYCILEQNNLFPTSPKWRCGKFASLMWNSHNLGEVRTDFFSEIESCFNEIQYRVTRRQTNESGLRDPYLSCKNQDSETPSCKKRDCETHKPLKKRDCETREIWLKFCETQSLWRTNLRSGDNEGPFATPTTPYLKNRAKTQLKRQSGWQTPQEVLKKGFLTAPTLDLSTMH